MLVGEGTFDFAAQYIARHRHYNVVATEYRSQEQVAAGLFSNEERERFSKTVESFRSQGGIALFGVDATKPKDIKRAWDALHEARGGPPVPFSKIQWNGPHGDKYGNDSIKLERDLMDRFFGAVAAARKTGVAGPEIEVKLMHGGWPYLRMRHGNETVGVEEIARRHGFVPARGSDGRLKTITEKLVERKDGRSDRRPPCESFDGRSPEKRAKYEYDVAKTSGGRVGKNAAAAGSSPSAARPAGAAAGSRLKTYKDLHREAFVLASGAGAGVSGMNAAPNLPVPAPSRFRPTAVPQAPSPAAASSPPPAAAAKAPVPLQAPSAPKVPSVASAVPAKALARPPFSPEPKGRAAPSPVVSTLSATGERPVTTSRPPSGAWAPGARASRPPPGRVASPPAAHGGPPSGRPPGAGRGAASGRGGPPPPSTAVKRGSQF
ncbi:Rossmann-like fold-containing protein [Azospirillum sp. TSO22-1]|uniref:Rossmann-like fold-containing protein n=1 Tax=Azospirillum sp. TSO22-1 TaxID=716789 RepID=UPI000D65ACD2|nr:Rossmann-like fold-containing protein [Azospirillum sp. TSO22-1]